jgi:hypothetical protein
VLRAIALIAVALAGCGDKRRDDRGTAAGEKADAGHHRIAARAHRGDAAVVRPSRGDCERLQAHRLELEADPSMKDVVKAASASNIDECLRELNKGQVECAAAARSGAEFGDCFVKHR